MVRQRARFADSIAIPFKPSRLLRLELQLHGFSWEEYMHDSHDAHRKAAEQHELAAQAHRTAAEHNEKGDNEGGRWHAERALEYSNQAYKLAKEAHAKSGQITAL
jgi:hypothetical protein